MPTQEEYDALERRIAVLEARINTWSLHGLSLADQRTVLLSPTGNNGTDITFARSDHSH
jgi:hypothetical protein